MSEAAATVSPVSPHDQVIGYLMGVIQGRAVICAAELGIADALADGPLSVQELATRKGIHPGNLFRLLRALESIGFFRETSPGVFGNNTLSDCLCNGLPGSLWPLVRMWGPGWGYWDGNAEMAETIRAGKTTLFERWGYDIWEHYRRKPEQWPVFNEAMRCMNVLATPAVTAAYDWGRFPVIADIAGGNGSQLVDILAANPAAEGILFDQAEVVAAAIPHPRVQKVAGNFFEQISVEADTYILRNIIHDWDDEAATSILRTLRASVKNESKVMLVEWLIPEAPGFHFGKWTDLIMMTGVGGRERTRSEFASLFREAGFELEDTVPTASHYTIVIGRPC
jgi:hypothetical protein